jgi:hypothetical protein
VRIVRQQLVVGRFVVGQWQFLGWFLRKLLG